MCEYNKESVVSAEEVESILNGIPDIIKVFNLDHKVCFCNEAGYDFYKRVPAEVKGEICYKLLNREDKCEKCYFAQVLRNKKKITIERYVPELNRIMDVCYSPVFDGDGELKFVIERLTDITEKKVIDKLLKDDKDRYEQILNNSPDALLIIVDNKIVLANKEAINLFESNLEDLDNSSVYKYFNEKYKKTIHKRFRNIILNEKSKDIYECELYLKNNKEIHVQLSCGYILYEGNPAILATIRDTSDTKKELNRAAQFQKNNLQINFPGKNLIDVVSSYKPAYTVSGDFYRIHEINDELLVGILIDVRGKGMTAALNVSALNLLFLQEVSVSNDPLTLIENINKKLFRYYDENYIAACCFSLDFNKREFKIVGAGINQFMFKKNGYTVEEKIIKGAFLGMFEDSHFSEMTISFELGDRIFLFSDGLDFVFDEDNIIKRYMSKVSVNEFKHYIDDYLEDTILEFGKLKDDSTMLAIEIKH